MPNDEAQKFSGGGGMTLRKRLLLTLLVCVLAAPLVVLLAIRKGSIHDEHQHVAAGVLLAREGLVPYRDYPYFHTPYLVFLYGALFKDTAYPLLVGRLLSALCSTLTLGLVFQVSLRLFENRSNRWRIGFAAAATVLVLASPVFFDSAGRAWNSDPSAFLMLGALALHLGALRGRYARTGLAVSGLLLGLAIGTRITIAPVALPFGLAILFFPPAPHRRLPLLAAFVGGLTLGSLPLFLMLYAVPRQTFFGIWEFARINVDYRAGTGGGEALALAKKSRDLLEDVLRPNFAIAGVALACVVAWLASARRESRTRAPEVLFLLLLLPFVFAGSFAPTPLRFQYFYICAPFLILIAVHILSVLPEHSRARKVSLIAFAIGVGFSAVEGFQQFRRPSTLVRLEKWEPLRIHNEGVALAKVIGPGRVLTLAPTAPIEGGLSIYPQLATGPFAWRIGPFVPAERRQELHILTADDLEKTLTANPPAAIMTGYEKEKWEKPFVEYAERYGYEAVQRIGKRVTWVRRKVTADAP